MFWIGLAAGYVLGFFLAWVLAAALRGWDRQEHLCAMDGYLPPAPAPRTRARMAIVRVPE